MNMVFLWLFFSAIFGLRSPSPGFVQVIETLGVIPGNLPEEYASLSRILHGHYGSGPGLDATKGGLDAAQCKDVPFLFLKAHSIEKMGNQLPENLLTNLGDAVPRCLQVAPTAWTISSVAAVFKWAAGDDRSNSHILARLGSLTDCDIVPTVFDALVEDDSAAEILNNLSEALMECAKRKTDKNWACLRLILKGCSQKDSKCALGRQACTDLLKLLPTTRTL